MNKEKTFIYLYVFTIVNLLDKSYQEFAEHFVFSAETMLRFRCDLITIINQVFEVNIPTSVIDCKDLIYHYDLRVYIIVSS